MASPRPRNASVDSIRGAAPTTETGLRAFLGHRSQSLRYPSSPELQVATNVPHPPVPSPPPSNLSTPQPPRKGSKSSVASATLSQTSEDFTVLLIGPRNFPVRIAQLLEDQTRENNKTGRDPRSIADNLQDSHPSPCSPADPDMKRFLVEDGKHLFSFSIYTLNINPSDTNLVELRIPPLFDGAVLYYDLDDRDSYKWIPEVLHSIRQKIAASALVGVYETAPISAQNNVDTKLAARIAGMWSSKHFEIGLNVKSRGNFWCGEPLVELGYQIVKEKTVAVHGETEERKRTFSMRLRRLGDIMRRPKTKSDGNISTVIASMPPNSSPFRSRSSSKNEEIQTYLPANDQYPVQSDPRSFTECKNEEVQTDPPSQVSPKFDSGNMPILKSKTSYDDKPLPSLPRLGRFTADYYVEQIQLQNELLLSRKKEAMKAMEFDEEDIINDYSQMYDDSKRKSRVYSMAIGILNDYAESPTDPEITTDTPIQGCAMDELLTRIVIYTTQDNQRFFREFFTTYTRFCEPCDLLERILDRFHKYLWASEHNDESKLSNAHLEESRKPTTGIQNRARSGSHAEPHLFLLRICEFLITWCEEYWDEDFSDSIKFKLHVFLEVCSTRRDLQMVCRRLIPIVFQDLGPAGGDQMNSKDYRHHSMSAPALAAKSFLIHGLTLHELEQRPLNKTFLDFDEESIAQQIILVQYECLRRVKAREFVLYAVSTKDRVAKCPNLNLCVQLFNHISYWLGAIVLSANGAKTRGKYLERFITIGKYLHDLNCYDALAAVLAGLSSIAIRRLRQAWECVRRESLNQLRELERIMSSAGAYGAYRAALRSLVMGSEESMNSSEKESELQFEHAELGIPCVPFLVVAIRDLTFLEQANPDKDTDGKINWRKFAFMAGVALMVKSFNATPYDIIYDSLVCDFILQKPPDEEELYRQSLYVEPRTERSQSTSVVLNGATRLLGKVASMDVLGGLERSNSDKKRKNSLLPL